MLESLWGGRSAAQSVCWSEAMTHSQHKKRLSQTLDSRVPKKFRGSQFSIFEVEFGLKYESVPFLPLSVNVE